MVFSDTSSDKCYQYVCKVFVCLFPCLLICCCSFVFVFVGLYVCLLVCFGLADMLVGCLLALAGLLVGWWLMVFCFCFFFNLGWHVR